jgi:hypothetical protein
MSLNWVCWSLPDTTMGSVHVASVGLQRTALLHLVSSQHGEVATWSGASDRQGKLIERDGQPQGHRLLDRELVVCAADVLHEGVP